MNKDQHGPDHPSTDVPCPTGALEAELAATKQALAEARERIALLEQDEPGARQQDEFANRVRNLLSVIRSIFMRTAETADSAEDVLHHFSGRLDAFARYQFEVSRSPGASADVETLVRNELLTAGAGDGPRITLHGPAAALSGRAAELFGLAVHELVTNSVKFGMLGSGSDSGALHISWTLAKGMFRFGWNETGVSIVSSAPLRYGFGRELIEEALPYQIGAQTSFEIVPGGIACTIVIPV